MKVSDVMHTKIRTVEPTISIEEAAKLMVKHHIGSLLVVSGIMLSGIVTDRDILRAFASKKLPKTKVRDVMTGYVVTIRSDASVADAASMMVKNKIKHIPVVDNRKTVGIVTMSDLVAHNSDLVATLSRLLPRRRKNPLDD